MNRQNYLHLSSFLCLVYFFYFQLVAGMAQVFSVPPTLIIKNPVPSSRIPEGNAIGVEVNIQSIHSINSMISTFDTNGDGRIFGPEEIKIITLPNSMSLTINFVNVQSQNNLQGPRLIQVFAFDNLQQMSSAVTSVFVGEKSSSLISPPDFDQSVSYHSIIGLGKLESLDFFPDSNLLLIGDNFGITKSFEMTNDHLEEKNFYDHQQSVTTILVAPDGKSFFTSGEDGTVIQRKIVDGTLLNIIHHHLNGPVNITKLAISNDQSRMLVAGSSPTGQHFIWYRDIQNKDIIRILQGHSAKITGLGFSPIGNYVFTASLDGKVMIWEQNTGNYVKTLGRIGESIESAVFSRTGNEVIVGYESGSVAVWEISSGKALFLQDSLGNNAHLGGIYSIALASDGQIATAGADNQIKIWENDNTLKKSLNFATQLSVLNMAYSGKSNMLFVAFANGQLYKIDLNTFSITPLSFPLIADQVGIAQLANNGDRAFLAKDNVVQIWNVNEGTFIKQSRTVSPISTLCLPPKEIPSILITGHKDGSALLWEQQTGDSLYHYRKSDDLSTVTKSAFSANNQTLAIGNEKGKIYLWNTSGSRNFLGALGSSVTNSHRAKINAITFSEDGSLIASGSDDSTVIVWNASTNQPLWVINDHRNQIIGADFLDGNKFLTVDRRGQLFIWQINESQLIKVDQLDMQPVENLASSITSTLLLKEKGHLLVGLDNGNVQLWDLIKKTMIASYIGHQNAISSLSFSRKKNLLLSGSIDGHISTWKAFDSAVDFVNSIPQRSNVLSVAISPDGKYFASGNQDRFARLWTLNGTNLATSPELLSSIKQVFFKASELMVNDGQTHLIWQPLLNTETRISPHKYKANLLGLNVHGTKLLSVGQDKLPAFCQDDCTTLKTILLNGLRSVDTLSLPSGISAMVASPVDSNLVLIAHDDLSIRLWNIKDNSLLQIFQGHIFPATNLAFSPDGAWAASCSTDRSVLLWDTFSGRLMHRFLLPAGVNAISFIPPLGKFLCAAAGENVYVWDVEKGQLHSIFGHKQEVKSIAVAGDGSKILTGSNDKSVRIWQFNHN